MTKWPTYTVDEFDGDVPLEKNARNFDNLLEAKTFARELFTTLKGGLHIDVYRADTGICFLTLPGNRRKNLYGATNYPL